MPDRSRTNDDAENPQSSPDADTLSRSDLSGESSGPPISDSTPRRPWLTPLTIFFVVFLASLGTNMYRGIQEVVSPFDEGYHLSYVADLAQGSLPISGDPQNEWTKQVFSCYPVAPFGEVTPVPCGEDGPSDAYPENGINPAAGLWPPIYYSIVAIPTKILVAVGVEPLFAARWVSSILWSLGAGLLALIALAWARSRIQAVAVGVLLSVAPYSWPLSAYVSPYAMVPLIAAALVFVVMRQSRQERASVPSLLLLGVTGLAVTLTIPHAIAAVLASAIALGWILLKSRGWRSAILSPAILLVGAVIGPRVWTLVQDFMGGASYGVLSSDGLLGSLSKLNWGLIQTNYKLFWPDGMDPGAFTSPHDAVFAGVLGMCSVALVGYWILQDKELPQKAFALGLIPASLTSIYFAVVLSYPVPPRYGASVLPLAFLLFCRPGSGWVYKTLLAALAVAALVMAWTTSYIVGDLPS